MNAPPPRHVSDATSCSAPSTTGVRASARAAIVWGHMRATVGSSLGGSGGVGLHKMEAGAELDYKSNLQREARGVGQKNMEAWPDAGSEVHA
eukprot:scaffold19577_cov17-Tisochrysis_lutea.AAC.1